MNIVIIGTNQGLGLELVRKFMLEGHKVAAGILGLQNTPAMEELLKQYSEDLMVFQADVTNEEEIKKGAELCGNFLGEVDSLCNVAGVIMPGDRVNQIQQCDISEIRKSFEVNTIGAVIVAKYFTPIMKKGGKLLTVTSEGTGVKNCITWIPGYTLSKTAATKISGIFNLSVEDVDYFSVHPGRMNTEMGRTTAQIEPQESAEGFYKLMTGLTPISRDEWYINYKGEPMEA